MAKAYDMVEWDILQAILLAHGFGSDFCKLILECISSAHFSVLVNGSPCGFFSGTRGIRQGDPISPALFVLLSDILSRILSRAESDGLFSGIKVLRTSPRITHLMYADDLVIYCKATTDEVTAVKSCLDCYSSWTGQKLNEGKSEVHFSPNVDRFTRTQLCSLLGMKECSHHGKYLESPFCRFRAQNADFAFVLDKLTSKLSGWKSKLMSIVGRITLIKSVTSALPSYIMQLFLLPRSLCDKLDRLTRRFLWGIKEDKQRFLSLRAWDCICAPKTAGGLGIRRAQDMNIAYITKLGWQLCTNLHKPWVKLVRSKYLRGRRIIDFRCTSQSSSWIWRGIQNCKASLDNGLCFQVGHHSHIRVREDPWIPVSTGYRVSPSVLIPDHIQYVSDFMNRQNTEWDIQLLRAIFPSDLCRVILTIPIDAMEQDRLVWIPNASGEFAVRSSYRVNNHERLCTASNLDKKVWSLLWNSPIHERHKVMLWRLMNNIIPTKDRLRRFLPHIDPNCLLCDGDAESLDHFLLHCPVAVICWMSSPWQIRISHFAADGGTKWLQLLLDENNCFPVEREEKMKIMVYVCLVFEHMWLWRNKIHTGSAIPDCNQFIVHLQSLVRPYWNAAIHKYLSRRRLLREFWSPPLPGELKLNFDASFIDHSATSAIVLRNHHGTVLSAWINHFYSSNSFCAELEAAIQALTVAEQMKLSKVWIEGDALQVILTLQGLDTYRDWRARDNIHRGRTLLYNHLFWSVKFVNLSCNFCAHKLAAWARSQKFTGQLDVTTIPPDVLCDRGGTFVPLDGEEPSNA